MIPQNIEAAPREIDIVLLFPTQSPFTPDVRRLLGRTVCGWGLLPRTENLARSLGDVDLDKLDRALYTHTRAVENIDMIPDARSDWDMINPAETRRAACWEWSRKGPRRWNKSRFGATFVVFRSVSGILLDPVPAKSVVSDKHPS
jgi:hypothetical protein